MPGRTAAIVVIGNEILTGKVQDVNAYYLCTELRELGVTLRRICVVPDEIDEIVAELHRVVPSHDYVFTSGGVGPTHDDVTMLAVARAFDQTVHRQPELEAMLRSFYAERLKEHHLRMADVPTGAKLIPSHDLRWPVITVENVFILPGIPEIFRRKFESVRERFRGEPFHLRVVFTRSDEPEIAPHLDATVAAFPGVDIGSYPRLDTPRYRVKVTLEARDPQLVLAAEQFLLQRLNPEMLVLAEVATATDGA